MTSGIEAAAPHDAAGRHEEAINALAKAAQDGDVESMTELARRLIVGDRAPFMPGDAARLFADAARGGGPEAALRLACLTALGAHVEQDWNVALGLLAHAAELGSEAARRQLRLLTGHSETAEDWRELARAVDVRAWLTPPPANTLNESPLVRQFSGFVEAGACDWLIERARDKLRPALTYAGEDPSEIPNETRTNSISVFNLASIDFVNVLLQYRMAAACGISVDHFEGPTVLHYEAGQQITDHYDHVNPRIPGYETEMQTRGERLITFLVYLNDDYEAGETDFPQLGVRHKGRRGDGLFFVNALPSTKPDPRMVHAGRPPQNGDKWLVSQFMREKAVYNTPAENVA